MRKHRPYQVVIHILDASLIVDITTEIKLTCHIVCVQDLLGLEGLAADANVVGESYLECVPVRLLDWILFVVFLDIIFVLFVLIHREKSVALGVSEKDAGTLEAEVLRDHEFALLDEVGVAPL